MNASSNEQVNKVDRRGHIGPRVRRGLLPLFFAFNALLAGCANIDTSIKPVPPGVLTSETSATAAYNGVPIHLIGTYRSTDTEIRILESKLSATISPGGKISSRFTGDKNGQKETPYDVTVEEVKDDGIYDVIAQVFECVKDTQNCSPPVEQEWHFIIDRAGPELNNVTTSTDTGMFNGSGNIFDKTTSVRDMTGVTCESEDKPYALREDIPLKMSKDGIFSFSLPAVLGENCATIIATDQVGNISRKKFSNTYRFDVGFTAQATVIGDKVTVSGTIPKSANPQTLKASGKQSQWRYFGIEGNVTCAQSVIDGLHYKIRCDLPSSTGGPARIHITFEDINGHEFEVYYNDKSDLLVHDIPDPSSRDRLAWLGQVAAGALATVLAGSSGMYGYHWVDDRKRKERGKKFNSSTGSARRVLVKEFADSARVFRMSQVEEFAYEQINIAGEEAEGGNITRALLRVANMDVSKVRSLEHLKRNVLNELVVTAGNRLEQIEKNPSIETLRSEEVTHLMKAVRSISHTPYWKFIDHSQVKRVLECVNSLRMAREMYSLSISDFEKKYTELWTDKTARSTEHLKKIVKGLFRWGNYTAAGVLIRHTEGQLRQELIREYNSGVTHMLEYLIRSGDYSAALSGYCVLFELNPEAIKTENSSVDGLLQQINHEFGELIKNGDRTRLNDKRVKDMIAVVRETGMQPWLQYTMASGFKDVTITNANELYVVGLAETGSLDPVVDEFERVMGKPDDLQRIIDVFTGWKDMKTLTYVADHIKDTSARDVILVAVSAVQDDVEDQVISFLAKRDQNAALAAVKPYKMPPEFEARIERIKVVDRELQMAVSEIKDIYEKYAQKAEEDPHSSLVTIMKGEDLEFWKMAYALPPAKARMFLVAMIAALKIPRTLVAGVDVFKFGNSSLEVRGVHDNMKALYKAFHPDSSSMHMDVAHMPGEPEKIAFYYFCSTLFRRIPELLDVETKKLNPELLCEYDGYLIDRDSYSIIMSLLSLISPGFPIMRGESVMYTIRRILEKSML